MAAIKKNEVEIGATYRVRLHGALADVKILRTKERNTFGGGKVGTRTGWVALNLRTNREVTIKSAAKLRRKVLDAPAPRR